MQDFVAYVAGEGGRRAIGKHGEERGMLPSGGFTVHDSISEHVGRPVGQLDPLVQFSDGREGKDPVQVKLGDPGKVRSSP